MVVTAEDVDRVPVGNLRVPRADFGSLWATADARNRELTERGSTDWYTAGVAVTCMWLADATHTPSWGRPFPARSPVGDRQVRAYEESIEAEYQAAESMAERQPWLLEQRPGWCEAIRATLRWAWRHEGPPPLDEAGEPAGWPAPRA